MQCAPRCISQATVGDLAAVSGMTGSDLMALTLPELVDYMQLHQLDLMEARNVAADGGGSVAAQNATASGGEKRDTGPAPPPPPSPTPSPPPPSPPPPSPPPPPASRILGKRNVNSNLLSDVVTPRGEMEVKLMCPQSFAQCTWVVVGRNAGTPTYIIHSPLAQHALIKNVCRYISITHGF